MKSKESTRNRQIQSNNILLQVFHSAPILENAGGSYDECGMGQKSAHVDWTWSAGNSHMCTQKPCMRGPKTAARNMHSHTSCESGQWMLLNNKDIIVQN